MALKVQDEGTGVSIWGGAVVIEADSVWVGLAGKGSISVGVGHPGGHPASVSVGLAEGGSVTVGVVDKPGKLHPVKNMASRKKMANLLIFNIVIPSL
jgi:hypothetical protein